MHEHTENDPPKSGDRLGSSLINPYGLINCASKLLLLITFSDIANIY
jgi:hypothetical protein